MLQLNKLRGVAEIRVGVFGGFGGGCLAGRGFSIGRGALQMRVNIAGSVFLFTVIVSSEGAVGKNYNLKCFFECKAVLLRAAEG